MVDNTGTWVASQAECPGRDDATGRACRVGVGTGSDDGGTVKGRDGEEVPLGAAWSAEL